ncbi:MAG: hypothetical protein EZS28_051355, partial [Streblomastix strix]
MENQKTDIEIGEKDPISGNGYGYTVTDTRHSESGKQAGGSIVQDINKIRLLDQTGSTRRSTKPVRTSYMIGCLCDKNEQTIAKVLQLVFRQRSIQSQRTEHELVQPRSLLISTSQLDSQGTSESREGQSTSENCSTGLERSGLVKAVERDESGGGGSGASRGVSGEESSDGGSESISPARRDENCKSDKHAAGEELFKQLVGRIGLDGETVNNVIESSSMETWRTRRAGLHVFCMYMEEKKMDLNEVLKARQNIILSNVFVWRVKKGGLGALEEMSKLETYIGVALSMFSDMSDVAQSPMVQAIVKRLNLERHSKA